MKAILMAAGMGTRISQKTNQPKSLLKVGNTSIIKHTVEMLQRNNIDVIIILGFKSHLIIEELKGLNVKFYINPFFRVTNSIASLWFAREELKDNEDIIFANADVYWEEDILELLKDNSKDVIMLGDKSRVEVGDYFFKCKNDKIIDYGKELDVNNRTCEYVGMAKISKDFMPEFVQNLDYLIKDEDYNLWWENILYSLSDKKDIHVKDVEGKFWGEVDTIEDYDRILNYINNKSM